MGGLGPAEKGALTGSQFVHGNGKVAGLVTTAVQVAVIHGDQVHVTEDEAVVGRVLLGVPLGNPRLKAAWPG